jgi:hypothetical protein
MATEAPMTFVIQGKPEVRVMDEKRESLRVDSCKYDKYEKGYVFQPAGTSF